MKRALVILQSDPETLRIKYDTNHRDLALYYNNVLPQPDEL
jgi:hypothetical protein